MGQNKFRFTMKELRALPICPSDSRSANLEFSDMECVGLRFLISKTNRRTFHLRYRYNGRKRVIRLGELDALTVVEARAEANRCKNLLSKGLDPLAERDKLSKSMSFQEYAEQVYLPWAKEHKKSWKFDQRKLEVDMYPCFAKLPLVAVSTRDIQSYIMRIKGRSSGANANRHWSVLSKMYSLAITLELAESNPCRGIKKFRENPAKEFFLSAPQIKKFLEALDFWGDSVSAWFLKWLLFTGLRMGESSKVRFEDIDMDSQTLLIRSEMAKNGRTRRVALSSIAMDVVRKMESLRLPGNPFLFAGAKKGQHIVSPKRVFEKAKKQAGIDSCRIHDLRHSFCSLSAQAGIPMYHIQQHVGHSSSKMTARYAHLGQRDMAKAGEGVAKAIAEAIE